jgi:hypothetical protein
MTGQWDGAGRVSDVYDDVEFLSVYPDTKVAVVEGLVPICPTPGTKG